MNKRLLLVGSLIAGSVVLTGCNTQESSERPTAPATQTGEEVTEQWQVIADAMASGKSAQCEMTNVETGDVSTYYLKGTNVRFDTINPTSPEQNGSFLSDGTVVYTWSDLRKEGVKFTIEAATASAAETMTDDSPESPDFSSREAWDDLENRGFTVNCQVTAVDPALFVPPVDVNFTDMSELTQQLQRIAPPANAEGEAPEFDQEQLQQMMEQYGE